MPTEIIIDDGDADPSGQEVNSYPADLKILEQAEVVYHDMPGWQMSTTNAKTYDDLPRRARDYVEVSTWIELE